MEEVKQTQSNESDTCVLFQRRPAFRDWLHPDQVTVSVILTVAISAFCIVIYISFLVPLSCKAAYNLCLRLINFTNLYY